MKIIGAGRGHGNYICEVNLGELQKFMGDYYTEDGNKIREISIGDTIDLSKGYDFYNKTKVALERTAEMINKNKDVIKAIMEGITLFNPGDRGQE